MSVSKIILVCLSIAVLAAAASANECQSLADQYVANYNSEHQSDFKLMQIMPCNKVWGENYVMGVMMSNAEGKYVSCMGIKTVGSTISNQGTCF